MQGGEEQIGLPEILQVEHFPMSVVQSRQELVENVEAGLPLGTPHNPGLLQQQNLTIIK